MAPKNSLKKENPEDQQFWDRIADMPFTEQEQECVLRREKNNLAIAMLKTEQANALIYSQKMEAKRLGVATLEVMAQNTMLNERIKYLRKLQDKINWRKAVTTLFGSDAAAECAKWLAQQEAMNMPVRT